MQTLRFPMVIISAVCTHAARLFGVHQRSYKLKYRKSTLKPNKTARFWPAYSKAIMGRQLIVKIRSAYHERFVWKGIYAHLWPESDFRKFSWKRFPQQYTRTVLWMLFPKRNWINQNIAEPVNVKANITEKCDYDQGILFDYRTRAHYKLAQGII